MNWDLVGCMEVINGEVESDYFAQEDLECWDFLFEEFGIYKHDGLDFE